MQQQETRRRSTGVTPAISQKNMANTAARSNIDDLMRYTEYSPKTNLRSDAEIDRKLVGCLSNCDCRFIVTWLESMIG